MIALDSSALIYYVEGSSDSRYRIAARLELAFRKPGSHAVASKLGRLECRVKPLREGNREILAAYERLFCLERLELVDVTGSILDRATILRATRRFGALDAIHLATALEHQVDVFLTGDIALASVWTQRF